MEKKHGRGQRNFWHYLMLSIRNICKSNIQNHYRINIMDPGKVPSQGIGGTHPPFTKKQDVVRKSRSLLLEASSKKRETIKTKWSHHVQEKGQWGWAETLKSKSGESWVLSLCLGRGMATGALFWVKLCMMLLEHTLVLLLWLINSSGLSSVLSCGEIQK